jgi:UDPglucose 6-dehydrogenase
MNISVIGIGYVGLVSAVCFAEMGHHVTCVDIDESKIEALKKGKVPIFEMGLSELLAKNQPNLLFTTSFQEAARNSNIIFIAVGTPQDENGSAYMQYFYDAVQKIADYMDRYTVIVNKSTVPIGTAGYVRSLIEEQLATKGCSIAFDVVSNPEFLREGTSIHDFMQPDRIILGTDSDTAQNLLKEVYEPLTDQGYEILFCDTKTAETIKYASNAFLAVKISFINELSALSDVIGADISLIAKGMGMDKRIGSSFLQAGPGFGGSCFPKDTSALCHTADTLNISLSIIKSAVQANERQKKRMCTKISNALQDDLSEKTIAVLGLAFKKNTDDMRYSPALEIVNYLYNKNAKMRVFDPAAMENAKNNYFQGMDLYYAKNVYDAISGADALVIITEWDIFKELDLDILKSTMLGNTFFDLRNIYQRKDIESAGFKYVCIGR